MCYKKIVALLLQVLLLQGCASFQSSIGRHLPEGEIVRNPALSERTENYEGFIFPKDKDAGCSASIQLSPVMRLGLLGFYARRTRSDDGTSVFIPPARFVRVLVAHPDGHVLNAKGMIDDFAQAVFFNIPKAWCSGTIVDAFVVSNDGSSVQSSDGKVFGALDGAHTGQAVNSPVDMHALATEGSYRRRFFKAHDSSVQTLPGVVTLGMEEKTMLDALVLLTAKETMQETAGARVFQRTGFFLDVMDFGSPIGLPMKAVFWLAGAVSAANGKPHGFTPMRCFTLSEVRENAAHFHAKEEDWRRRHVAACKLPFFAHEYNSSSVGLIQQEKDCLDIKTASEVIERSLQNELRFVRESVQQCQ